MDPEAVDPQPAGPPEAPAPPPGWYPDAYGLRWWDGAAWGAYAPPAAPGHAPYPFGGWSEEESGKTAAIFAHLGCVFGGFLLPLVIYLTQKDQNRFTRHHAAEALNFQLTLIVGWVGVVAVAFGGLLLWGATSDSTDFPWPLILVVVAIALVGVSTWVFSIIGAIKASQKEWWTYPIRIRFVR